MKDSVDNATQQASLLREKYEQAFGSSSRDRAEKRKTQKNIKKNAKRSRAAKMLAEASSQKLPSRGNPTITSFFKAAGSKKLESYSYVPPIPCYLYKLM